MNIRISPSIANLAPALSTPAALQPAASSLSTAAKSPYQFGESAKRLGKYGTFPMLTPKSPGAPPAIDSVSAPLAKKAAADAKELIHRAETLIGSKVPSDRSEGYQLIQQAADRLRASQPELAAQFDTVADKLWLRDPQVKEYDGLVAWQFSKDQANKLALEHNNDASRGWDQLPIKLMFAQAIDELNKL